MGRVEQENTHMQDALTLAKSIDTKSIEDILAGMREIGCVKRLAFGSENSTRLIRDAILLNAEAITPRSASTSSAVKVYATDCCIFIHIWSRWGTDCVYSYTETAAAYKELKSRFSDLS